MILLEKLVYRYPITKALFFLAPTLIFLVLLFIIPIFKIFLQSIWDPAFTLRHYFHIFEAPIYLRVFYITFRLTFLVTLVCFLLGYPVAYLLAKVEQKTSNLLMILVMIPFWTSLLVRTYAWIVLLQKEGLINKILIQIGIIDTPLRMMYNSFGVTIGMVHILLPFMILPLFSVMKGIDKDLIKASQNLGANNLQSFLKIYFPLSLPGVAAGCLLVSMLSLGFFITPSLLGGSKDFVVSMAIEMHVNELVNWGFASALAMLLLLVTLFFFLIYDKFFGLDRMWGGV
jgi:putative spermidine/putrescine transport system permease protein